MRVLFAHGFEGGPSGSKPIFMRDVLGWDVTAPVMSELGWDIEKQTEVLLREIDESDYDLVIGSSMGGLAAANASSLRGDSGFRLLLIAPAFGLSDSWEGLTGEELSEWRDEGTRRYRGFELDIDLEWGFMEAAMRMSWPGQSTNDTCRTSSYVHLPCLTLSPVELPRVRKLPGRGHSGSMHL